MRKAYFKTIEDANKVANEIILKTKFVLPVLYDTKKQMYFIEY